MAARILLIEDNPPNLELMSYLLGAFGYQALSAVDGLEGLDMARQVPDLIICDLQLPTMNGYEVARQLKADAALRAIPLVAVTAFAMVGDREKVLAAGFDGYITKPIDPETFVRQIEGFLRQPRHAPAAPASPTSSAAPSQPATGYTILAVDNLPVNLELARSILEPHGYRVLTADGVARGLALAREPGCDLILSDVCMTGESGYDFLRAVKSDPALRSIPFLFLTSTMLERKDRDRGLALGAARFLTRPLEPQALLEEIEACVREKGRS